VSEVGHPDLQPGSGRYAALDGMRGLCALTVIMFHLNAGTHFYEFLQNSYVSIDFFFVLSGFILASTYDGKVHSLRDCLSVLVRRIGRLYPLHVFVLSLMVVLTTVGSISRGKSGFVQDHDLASLAQHIFFVQGLTQRQLTWNFPAWSASIEFWVNFGFFVLLLVQRPLHRFLAEITIGGLLLWLLLAQDDIGFLQAGEGAALLKLAYCTLDFVTGSILFRIRCRLVVAGWAPPSWAILSGVAFAALPYVIVGGDEPYIAIVPPFALAVLLLSFSKAGVFPSIGAGALSRLGRLSYSIYLTQALWTAPTAQLVIGAGRWLKVTSVVQDEGRTRLVLGGAWVMDGVALLCLAAVIAGAHLTYRFVEDPARLYFNRLSRGRRGAEVESARPPAVMKTDTLAAEPGA
jgi:peptidoglycan/LPS O-acetylase OafA/YrhL